MNPCPFALEDNRVSSFRSSNSLNSFSPQFPVASTSKVPFPNRSLAISPWLHSDETGTPTFPCDDCIPFVPSPSPFSKEHSVSFNSTSRSSRPSSPPTHSSSSLTKKDTVSSYLASYRFPHGLPTPASSRQTSPTLSPLELEYKPDFRRDVTWEDEGYFEMEEDLDDNSDDDVEEEEFRRIVMKGRECEFDGDMEEWDNGSNGRAHEWKRDGDDSW